MPSERTAGKVLIVALLLTSLPLIYAVQNRQRTPKNANAQKARSPVTQDIEVKLAQKITFVPGSDKPTLEQLIEVAKYYKLPMGIEWAEGKPPQEARVTLPLSESGATVRDLLSAIMSGTAEHQLTVKNGVVHIASPVLVSAPRNFLNVEIDDFEIKDNNLFEAEEELRIAIDTTLHPEEYEGGYAGGFGYAPDDPLAKSNITFKGQNMRVRAILDGLVKSSGNALWLVRLKDIDAGGVDSAQEANQKSLHARYPWKFVPLDSNPKL